MTTEPHIIESAPEEIQAWLESIGTKCGPIFKRTFPLIQESVLTPPTNKKLLASGIRITTFYSSHPVLGGGWRAMSETGVRSIRCGVLQSDLHRIEHGWVDYKAAHAFIRELLESGVDAREVVTEAERERRFAEGMAVLTKLAEADA